MWEHIFFYIREVTETVSRVITILSIPVIVLHFQGRPPALESYENKCINYDLQRAVILIRCSSTTYDSWSVFPPNLEFCERPSLLQEPCICTNSSRIGDYYLMIKKFFYFELSKVYTCACAMYCENNCDEEWNTAGWIVGDSSTEASKCLI